MYTFIYKEYTLEKLSEFFHVCVCASLLVSHSCQPSLQAVHKTKDLSAPVKQTHKKHML